MKIKSKSFCGMRDLNVFQEKELTRDQIINITANMDRTYANQYFTLFYWRD